MPEDNDARPGVRVSLYLSADAAERLEDYAWDSRLSRSKIASDAILAYPKPPPSRLPPGLPVRRVRDATGDTGSPPDTRGAEGEGTEGA